MASHKSVLITGAAGGLGRCTAEYLASRGWNVFASDLPAAIAVLEPQQRITHVAMDVTDAASVARAVTEVREMADGLDAVVNFAGILVVGSMIELQLESVQRVVDVNVWGTFRVNQAFFPLLCERKGRIVNLSSETGWQSGGPFNGAYGLSKHAIEAYSDSLRRELALLDMKVIKVQPGPFRTNMVKGIDASFRKAADGSALFKVVLDKVRQLALGEEAKASEPELLAETIFTALTVERPKAAYSVRPDPARSLLEYLPTSWADGLLKLLLKV